MRTNSASMASLLMAGSSATSWRIGIQLATTARSTCHFLSASNLMNFQAASGYLANVASVMSLLNASPPLPQIHVSSTRVVVSVLPPSTASAQWSSPVSLRPHATYSSTVFGGLLGSSPALTTMSRL